MARLLVSVYWVLNLAFPSKATLISGVIEVEGIGSITDDYATEYGKEVASTSHEVKDRHSL